MLSIFDRIYNWFFSKRTFDHKIGEVVYASPTKKASEKTKAILKIYGRNGFIVCEVDKGGFKKTKPSVKLLSRQHFLKYNKEKGKMDRKFWMGWILLDEIVWEKIEKYRL